MATVTEVGSEADFNTLTSNASSSSLLVVYFHAPWAAPCQQMSTVLKTLAGTYPAGGGDTAPVFLSINAEDVPEVAENYDVTAVPYIVLQKGGQTVETVSGSDAAKVRAAVERHAGKADSKTALPPAQSVTMPEQQRTAVSAPHDGTNGTKNLAGYAPGPGDAVTAPEHTAGAVEAETSKEELFKRLEGLVKSAPVMLFMKGTPSAPQCGFSRQTVGLLRERSIRYGFFNILADDEVRQGLKEYADWPTFPQLWVNGELVGGLDIVKEEFEGDPDYLMEHSVKREQVAAAS